MFSSILNDLYMTIIGFGPWNGLEVYLLDLRWLVRFFEFFGL